MDKFDEAENNGRQLFKSILDQCNIVEQHQSIEKYDTIDYYYSLNGKKSGVEIKKRAKKYECYDTHLMEMYKLKALYNRWKNKELDNVYYVCFFGNDTAYTYPIQRILKAIKNGQIKPTYMNLGKTSVINTGTIEKQIIMIPKNLAYKLARVNGKWIKQ